MPIKYVKKPVPQEGTTSLGEPIVTFEDVFVKKGTDMLKELAEKHGMNVNIKTVKGDWKVQENKAPAKEEEEVMGVLPMLKPMCNVGLRAGQTVNTGDYNSIKVEVSLNVPCHIEELDDTYSFAQNWIDEKMNAILEDIEKVKKG